MNAASSTCPKCGQTVPVDAHVGLCPRCLVAEGLSTVRAVAANPIASDSDSNATVHIVIPEGRALPMGLNVLVFKVVNVISNWRGSIRFTDTRGNPLKGILVTLTP